MLNLAHAQTFCRGVDGIIIQCLPVKSHLRYYSIIFSIVRTVFTLKLCYFLQHVVSQFSSKVLCTSFSRFSHWHERTLLESRSSHNDPGYGRRALPDETERLCAEVPQQGFLNPAFPPFFSSQSRHPALFYPRIPIPSHFFYEIFCLIIKIDFI